MFPGINRGIQHVFNFVAFVIAAYRALEAARSANDKIKSEACLQRLLDALDVASVWFREVSDTVKDVVALPGAFAGKAGTIKSGLAWAVMFGDPFKGSRAALAALLVKYANS